MKTKPIIATVTARDRAVQPQSALHVIADLNPEHGGSVRAVADLCASLGLSGVECEIASLHRTVRSSTNLPVAHSKVRLFRALPPRRLGNSLEFARWLVRNVDRYDIVEIHEIFRVTSLMTALVARRHRVPYLVHPHGSLDPFDLRKHRRTKRVLAPLFRHLLLDGAHGIVFTSVREEQEADTFSSGTPRYHVPPVVLDNPIRGDGLRIRQALGIAAETFLLLFMSRIDYKKGLLRALQALRIAVDLHDDVELVIAGSGEPAFEHVVRAEVAALRLERFVHFVGFLDGRPKADALAAADALILVSDNENFGIIVVEALRAGVPVIVSDRVAIASELQCTGAARVVAPDDAATAAAVHDAVSLDGDDRRRLSQTARRVGERLYNSESVVQAQLALRQQVLSVDRPRFMASRGMRTRSKRESRV